MVSRARAGEEGKGLSPGGPGEQRGQAPQSTALHLDLALGSTAHGTSRCPHPPTGQALVLAERVGRQAPEGCWRKLPEEM